MDHVINEMIEELRNDIIPVGDDLLGEMTEEDEYFGETTEDHVDEDPIERLIRPTRGRQAPV